MKYNEEKHANIKSHVLGRLIKKIYPEARKFYPLDKNTDKQVTGYKGICFSSSDKENRNLDLVFSLQDVSSHLPKTTVQLPSEVDGEVNIAVFSKMSSNGNNICKIITLTDHSWKLSIRGTNINLQKFGVSDKFKCTTENLNQVVKIVDRMQICTGVFEEDLELSEFNRSTTIQESINKEGDHHNFV